MAKNTSQETPLMKQYFEIKAKYPGAILLFRVGDFYETFGEDAIKASQILGIVLTKRANGAASHIELAGFPHHSLDTYLPKLVRAGQRVAICDQLEDPKLTKKIVKRGVTELVTPGVSYNDKILDYKSNNYLCAVWFDKNQSGVAFLDISTGEFLCGEGKIEYINKLIQGLKPAEIILCKQQRQIFEELNAEKHYTFLLDDWIFTYDYTYEKLTRHFSTNNLKGFGIQELTLATIAAGACLHYLNETHHNEISHIQRISRIEEEKYVWLDRFTIRNLELLSPNHDNGKALIDVLDKTITPMGSRLLKRWLVLPLKEIQFIEERLNTVEAFLKDHTLLEKLNDELKQVNDIERMVSKVAMNRISPRELAQLNKSLKHLIPIKALLLASTSKELNKLANQINDCTWVIDTIDKTLKPDPPAFANRGDIIQSGLNEELDQLRAIAFNGKDYLVQIQTREQEKTGIPSLKVGFNNVFGYYLEVTNTHKHKVPAEWIRKQTLTNGERYITEELKEYEEKILGAEEKIYAIEERMYGALVNSLIEYVNIIQHNSLVVGKLDCLHALAKVAIENKYCKPELSSESIIQLQASRHPVIERQLPADQTYIPNDIYLDKNQQQIIILTGPNMSGKSAILRQTALVIIMAQIGSFVPASAAVIGITDKIFTRVGASDNISSGESTFMVEMTETASILNNLSDNSLVLLDEIGRGTSTYDGISIAWAITEFIANHPCKPKTLFATHYHELNDLEKQHTNIKNYHIEIKETQDKVIFLRKLSPGGTEHSFGIHVAKMAGVPQLVTGRAQQILKELESNRQVDKKNNVGTISPAMQLSMFQLNDPVLEQVKTDLMTLDINTISPVEALMKLHEIKKMLN